MKKITRSHKKMNPDIKAIFATSRALRGSSNLAMLEANLAFVAGHFGFGIYPLIREPTKIAKLAEELKLLE